MNLLHWLRRLQGKTRTHRGAATAPRPRPGVPLRLEPLERRVVPATLTWTGGGPDGLWSDAANWRSTDPAHRVPRDGDDLQFLGGVTRRTADNDLRGLALGSLAFAGAGYHLTGRDFVLTGGITMAAAASGPAATPVTNTIDPHIDFVQTQFLEVIRGDVLVLAGGMTTSGAGRLTLSNFGTVQLGGNSVASGALEIDSGMLLVAQNATLDVQGDLTVEAAGTLTDAGSVHVSKLGGRVEDFGRIEVTAAPVGQAAGDLRVDGTLTVEHGGTLTDAGNVSLNGASASPKADTPPPPRLDDFGTVAVLTTGTLNDNALMTVEPGATLDDGGALTVGAGAALVSRGDLAVEPDQTLTVLGTVTSGAAQPATLTATLTGNATPAVFLKTPGALSLNDAGATELNLTAADDLAPTLGQQFTLVANATGRPITGLFSAGGVPLQEGDTVRAGRYDFAISYNGGTGNDVVLAYAGLHHFDITIANELSTPVTIDGNDLPLSAEVSLVAGDHLLADKNSPTASLPFAVNDDGTVSYDIQSEGILAGANSHTLDVRGVAVTIDSTGIAPLASSFSVDGSAYPTGQVGTFRLLPGPFVVAYSANGMTTTLDFEVSAQDQVTFNPSGSSQDELASVQGGNGVVLRAPAAQTFPITINANFLFQFPPVFAPSYTLNGVSEKPGVQTFDLPAGPYVIQYQLPDPTVAGRTTTYTLTFGVLADGTVTIPEGESGLLVVDGVLTLVPPG